MANRWTLNEEHLNVDKYLRACVNLYGYVTPRQFLKLYNRYNTPKINKEKYLRWAERLQNHSYEHYIIYTNAVISARVSNRKIDEIIYYQTGKKYYDPPKEELLAYADPDYREQNEYTGKLYDFLVRSVKINRLVAEGYVSKLVWGIRIEEPLQAVSDLTESCGIVFKDDNQINEWLQIIQDLSNNTRKWANCGYTPTEMCYGRYFSHT